MKKQMRSVVRSQFVRGLSSMLEISGTRPRNFKAASPMAALRGDMVKIGEDMHRVVERERRNEKTARKTIAAAE